ncbi:serine hydrolase [Ekhidna sp.]|uniref:serine hydrolase domain-containing protein n=1 Tax=Ekhidna sp. TaxID=2608089 RepID=UPI00329A54C2
MKSYIRILFLLISTSVFSTGVEINEGVWINGDSFYKSIKHKKKSTIYFAEWSPFADQFLKDEDYYVAIQLTNRFDPLPNDDIELPSLKTLAAVSNDDLIKDYFRFLESFGRTYGINHMVLPDSSNLSRYEKEVVKLANNHSPYYFLHRSSLSRTIPESKKDFEIASVSKPTIWIAEQDADTKKLKRWSSKIEERNQSGFYASLGQAKTEAFIPAFNIPQVLFISIFNASVVAIDPFETFPLTSKVVSYLGADLKLKQRLEQYANVLEYRLNGVPCIVDLRDYEREIDERDILIQTGLKLQKNTSLALPENSIPNVDIYIAKMLFGANKIIGRSSLPNTRQIEITSRLGYTDPNVVGLNPNHLLWVDSLAIDAIRKYATPGIQLAVIKNGDIVMEKSYGFYTYDSLRPVSSESLYDIASLTKVIATLPAVGLLIDQGLINLDDSLSKHLPDFGRSNKSGVTIKQLLAHNAGLRSYVPFWSMVLTGDMLDAFYYKTPEDEANDIRSYGLEPHPNMLDSLKSFIVKSDLIKNRDSYNYSDLGFMILHLLVEEVSGMSFDKFLKENFYTPMGMTNTTFNPLRNGISPKDITPTEYDNRYRNYQVWGEVHDRNALVFGGVAGHAGLFSTATDLAKMMSMFMNNGYFGGRQYLSKETITLFNRRYFSENRRGLGWDKKDGEKDSASSLASDESFGHTGFTGTMVWADPEKDLVYIFLSNRIYPDANNWRLGELNTRTHIHDVIHQSLKNSN